MRRYIQILIFLFLVSSPTKLLSQISVTNYSIFIFGLNTNQEKRISGDLKVFTYLYGSELQTELGLFYNFKPKDYHRFSIGLGVNLYPFAGFDHIYALTIPIQLEVFPLQEFKRLSLVYELSPALYVESNIGIRNLFGIRYTFGRRSKEEKTE